MKTYSKKLLSLFLIALFLTVLVGTTGCRNAEYTVSAEPADHVDPRLVEANNTFALDLFHALWHEAPGENLFISPASVSMALAMTYNGAAGETAAAMEDVLQIKGMPVQEVNEAFADLRSILENPDPNVELAIANSLWARQGVAFNDDFLQQNQDYFGARVAALDFDRPDAADTINQWVEEQTKGKIKDLIEPPIHPLTVLFLINAIYFQADWAEPFDPELTRTTPFHLPDGSQKEHPLMFREGDYQYLDGDGFQAVSIPYGKNERLSMYVFLPNPELTLQDFYSRLSPGAWQNWMESFWKTEGLVGLPRFTYEYEVSLNDALKALGMEVAFDDTAADFSGMRPIPPRLFIADVKHKSFIDVNEEGTEAAAATSVEIRAESAPMDRFSMIVDRPFCFSIVDNKTGSILFMGSVTEPLQ